MAKDTCEDYIRLSIFRLKEWGYLDVAYRSGTVSWENGWGRKSSIGIAVSMDSYPTIKLTYKSGDEDHSYDVRLVSELCHFGGKRYWFICPLTTNGRYCGRRCAMLYGSRYFGCRKCHDLAYSTQQVSYSGMFAHSFALITFSDKIDEKLSKMRVKFWHGRPTKRYAKLLRKMERMGSMSYMVDLELERMRSLKRSLRRNRKMV